MQSATPLVFDPFTPDTLARLGATLELPGASLRAFFERDDIEIRFRPLGCQYLLNSHRLSRWISQKT